jgi:hypothetical protein
MALGDRERWRKVRRIQRLDAPPFVRIRDGSGGVLSVLAEELPV